MPMTQALRWTGWFWLVLFIALLGGPLLSTVPWLQTFPFTFGRLNGTQTFRLLVEGIGLITLGLVATHAYRLIPDTSAGFAFVRNLVFPLSTLVILIVADRAIRVAGYPLINQVGTHSYRIIHATSLIMAGLWITHVWLSNRDSLVRFFSASTRPIETTTPSWAWADDANDEASEMAAAASEDGPSAPSPHRNSPPTLGRYKILKELGRGAMGVVYLGKDPTIHRFVAIKTMRLDHVEDHETFQAAKARFFREAESAGRLSHPNIVTIFDAGEEEDLGYIAMELVQGTTLTRWCRPPDLLPLDRLLSVLATVADALDYAHQQGVIHRDIKPANIMLTKDDVVKVMDFGIATMTSSPKTSTTVMGTPTYMSPEQIAGKKVDGRSDIFSLGVVLFELLTGRPPFTGNTVPAVLFAIANTPPPRLAELRADLPAAFQDVLDRVLHKNPIYRYRTAGELASALRSLLTTPLARRL
ncbi:MAG: serine/threonine protein kinase [Nitrospira sp.]|nr:serine/threonine protein kinase [Nitrospira sp.]